MIKVNLEIIPLCKCGCGEEVTRNKRSKKWNKYLLGHGRPCKGKKQSQELIDKRVLSRKGYKHSEETKRKISKGNKGKKLSEETKRKISKGSKGKILSEEHKLKLRNNFKGRKHTLESRQKMSEVQKGRITSEETKKKQSEAKKGIKNFYFGKHRTEETKRKISKSNKGKISIVKNYEILIKSVSPLKKCGCGCNVFTKWNKRKQQWSDYLNGHSRRNKAHSEETKKRLSIVRTGRPSNRKGEIMSQETRILISCTKLNLSRNEWKGFANAQSYCDAWKDKEYKEDIRKRDDCKCKNPDCNYISTNKVLDIHHIDYNRKNCAPDNLITLCRSCNTKANYKREYWQEYYQEKNQIHADS